MTWTVLPAVDPRPRDKLSPGTSPRARCAAVAARRTGSVRTSHRVRRGARLPIAIGVYGGGGRGMQIAREDSRVADST